MLGGTLDQILVERWGKYFDSSRLQDVSKSGDKSAPADFWKCLDKRHATDFRGRPSGDAFQPFVPRADDKTSIGGEDTCL